MKKPKIYIIPGWGEKITSKNYRDLIHSARSKYAVVPVKCSFSRKKLFSENIEDVKRRIVDACSQDVIFGFSIGALIAYQLATKIKFKLAIICSISPILNKDLLLYSKKDRGKVFADEQIKELNKMTYRRPISPFVLFYGSLETFEVIKRSKKLHKHYGGTLISIAKCGHRLVGDYLETVKKQL